MIGRVVNGIVATIAIVAFGQCTAPTDPPAAAPTTTVRTPMVVPAVVSTSDPRSRLTPPRPVPVQTLPSTTVVAQSVSTPGLLPAPQWASWPSWRVTAEGVPYYRGRPACTVAQAEVIAAEFGAKGASIDTQRWAIYVASREGGCNYLATNINARTDDNSHCAFQLNAISGGPLSPAGVLGQLGWTPATVKASLAACADAASDLWAKCGKGPWIKNDYGCRRPTS